MVLHFSLWTFAECPYVYLKPLSEFKTVTHNGNQRVRFLSKSFSDEQQTTGPADSCPLQRRKLCTFTPSLCLNIPQFSIIAQSSFYTSGMDLLFSSRCFHKMNRMKIFLILYNTNLILCFVFSKGKITY